MQIYESVRKNVTALNSKCLQTIDRGVQRMYSHMIRIIKAKGNATDAVKSFLVHNELHSPIDAATVCAQKRPRMFQVPHIYRIYLTS